MQTQMQQQQTQLPVQQKTQKRKQQTWLMAMLPAQLAYLKATVGPVAATTVAAVAQEVGPSGW
jgi:hypothetical protein